MNPKLATVLGVGIDLVENGRIKRVLSQWGRSFKNRVFLPAEQAYCEAKAQPWHHYAGRYAVKEAVSKAVRMAVDSGIVDGDEEED